MAWECIIPEKAIEDVKKDKKGAKRVEQYLVSENALYFEGKYLPLNLIESVSIHDRPLILMVEKDKNAQKLADMLMSTQRTEDEE